MQASVSTVLLVVGVVGGAGGIIVGGVAAAKSSARLCLWAVSVAVCACAVSGLGRTIIG